MDAKPIRSVLIVGGGLGGLALAQALRKTNFEVTIFERDAEVEGRMQGYILGINDKGEEALLSLCVAPVTEFLTAYRSRFRSFKCTDDQYKKLMQFPYGGKGQGCLVDRWRLRMNLMHGLGEGEAKGIKMVWGKRFLKYEENEDGVEVFFEDGTSAKGDVLVGADGSRSRVREQRTKDIVYEQLSVANIGAAVLAPSRPTLDKLQDCMATSLIRVFGIEGVSLLAMPFLSQEDNHIVWSLTFPCNDQMVADMPDIKPYLLEKAVKVNQDAVELIRSTPPQEFLSHRMMHSGRLLNKNPLRNTTRVTLMGDAAHPMTSHAGLGANTAFLDALDLAKALSSPAWHSELAKYERTMFKRGYENVNISLQNTERMTKESSAFGAKVRNWMMWSIGLVVGGESKVEG